MPIKIVQLNVEKNRHLDKVIPFLKKQNADVVCLQEVMQHDIATIEKETGLHGFFAPISFQPKINDVQGNVILSRYPIIEFSIYTYIHMENYLGEKLSHNISIAKIAADTEYTIMCTHFPVTPNGKIDDNQKKAWDKLKIKLASYDQFVLAGDFNAPRGREMFAKFTEMLKDNLPPEVKTTLDPKHHRHPHLVYAVDNIFSKNMVVSNVKVVDNLSDHKAIVATITKDPK